VFTAACSSTATSRTSDNSNAAATTNNAPTEDDTTTNVERAFKIDFRSEPGTIQAGQPATLAFTVKDKQGGVVKDLQIVHEKPMHLLVVSRDLAEFYHIHPEQSADGSYRVEHTFPNGGEYKLYADFTPKEATQVVEQVDLKVGGQERAAVPLVADTKFEKTVDGLRVVMKPDGEIKAANELMLNFAAFDAASGKPATIRELPGRTRAFCQYQRGYEGFRARASDVERRTRQIGKVNAYEKATRPNADGHKQSTTEGAKREAEPVLKSRRTAFRVRAV
jgi:hypothetical protein